MAATVGGIAGVLRAYKLLLAYILFYVILFTVYMFILFLICNDP